MKSLAALITTVVLALGSIATAEAGELPSSTSSPAERAASKVSLQAKSAYVRRGDLVHLSGRVKGAGGGRLVVIYQKNVGAKRWVVEARRTTNRTGRFRHREDIKSGDRYYQACSKGKCSKKLLVHMGKPPKPPKPPKQPTSLSVSGVAPASIEAGQAVTVSGTASGNMAGQVVYVQAYDAGSSTWGAVGSATVNGAGVWGAAATLTTAGRAIALRVVFNGSKELRSSSVTAGSVSVYGWYYLSDRSTVEGDWDSTGSFRISGTTYPKSVAEDTEFIQVDLARACIQFAAVVGLSDSSPSGSRAAVRLLADSTERYANTNLTLGVGNPVTFDLTGALRLVVEPSEVVDAPYVVLGDARILCAY